MLIIFFSVFSFFFICVYSFRLACLSSSQTKMPNKYLFLFSFLSHSLLFYFVFCVCVCLHPRFDDGFFLLSTSAANTQTCRQQIDNSPMMKRENWFLFIFASTSTICFYSALARKTKIEVRIQRFSFYLFICCVLRSFINLLPFLILPITCDFFYLLYRCAHSSFLLFVCVTGA